VTFTRERVRFDSPGSVVDEMESVYDLIAELQVGHVEAAKEVAKLQGRVKALTARLHDRTHGTVEDRKMQVQRMLEQADEWASLQLAEAELAGCKVDYDYLDARRSVLQSVLKQFQHDAAADRFGSGRPQRVVTE
jgi:alkylated DNA nucleotide flippase Atl1